MQQQYEVSVELASGELGRLGVGRSAHRVVLLRRLEKNDAWDDALLDGAFDSALRARGIHHPSLLAVLDVVRAPGAVVIATEYVEGVPLSLLMARARESGRRLPVRATLRIADELTRALIAADELLRARGHSVPLVGLHPDCVVVSGGDDALIADLGMVSLERVPARPGLGVYRAPELAAGRAGQAAPVYGLGVVLWELLSGRDAAGQAGPLPRFDGDASEVPALLVELVMQSVSREPSARIPDLAAFAKALAAVGKSSRPGVLLRTMNELCADVIERQRSVPVLGAIAPSSSRATVHALETMPPPAMLRAPRRIGLAAFERQSPAPPEPAPPSEVKAREPRPAAGPPAPAAPAVPAAPAAPAPAPAPVAPQFAPQLQPQPLVHKPTAPAIAFDPDLELPPPRRRWGLALFIVLLLGGVAAGAVYVAKRELEAPAELALPAPVPLPEAGTGTADGALAAPSTPAPVSAPTTERPGAPRRPAALDAVIEAGTAAGDAAPAPAAAAPDAAAAPAASAPPAASAEPSEDFPANPYK